MNTAWWGLLGPLVVLLNATGVTVFSALRVALLLVVFGVAGLSVTHYFGLNRVPGSVIGQLSLALALSLAIVTLGSQLLGLVGRSQFNSFLVLIPLCLPMARSAWREVITQRLVERPSVEKYELSAIWFLIFGVLTTSSYVFVVGALLVLFSHLIIHLIFSERKQVSSIDFVPIWISVVGVYVASIWLGWKYQSPWAFSLRSLDNANWVSMAWAVDRYGWATDPTTAGFPMSYHFLAQAQAGLVSRVADVSLVAMTGVVLPIVAAAAGFTALRSFSAQYVSSRVATLIPSVVLLSCLGPLEPNGPMSTEHFTYLVSVAYLCISLLILGGNLPTEHRRRSVILVIISVIITATKVNTAVLLPGLSLSLALGALLHRKRNLAKRFLAETVMLATAVSVAMWTLYLRHAAPSSHRVVLGFNSLEYRFGMIGGPYLGGPISIFLLVLFLLPIAACLLQLAKFQRARAVDASRELILTGLSISAIGLFASAFVFTVSPTGKPEIYLVSTGLVFAVLVSSHLAVDNYRRPSTGYALERLLAIGCGLLVVVSSTVSVAWLWSERFQSWPSEREFLLAYVLPYATIFCCVFAFLMFRLFGPAAKPPSDSNRYRSAFSLFLALLITAGVSTNIAYGLRGPLKTLVGITANRVSLAEFSSELRESADISRPYLSLLETIESHTPMSAIVVSNIDFVGHMLVVSEGQRRTWWVEINTTPGQGTSMDHLAWRQRIVRGYFAKPNANDVRSMSRCGVTHAVIVKNQSSVTPDHFIIPGLSLLRFSDDQYLVLEFIKSGSDTDIPDPNWLKWCNPSNS